MVPRLAALQTLKLAGLDAPVPFHLLLQLSVLPAQLEGKKLSGFFLIILLCQNDVLVRGKKLKPYTQTMSF